MCRGVARRVLHDEDDRGDQPRERERSEEARYPASTVAGVSHSFTVTARDAFGNTDTNYAGTMHFTATNDALRASMLRGVPFSALWPQLGILALWMTICFAIALKIFRWR